MLIELAGKPLMKACLPMSSLKAWVFLIITRRNQMSKCWGWLERGPSSSSSSLQLTCLPRPRHQGTKLWALSW